MKYTIISIFSFILFCSVTNAQFGRNKVQYNQYEWYFLQTKHFDIYFDRDAGKMAEFGAIAAEQAIAQIQRELNYFLNNRVSIIFYNSQNDFQETNVIDSYLSEGTGGFTELFKNRVVLPFTGDYKLFRHVIHHELLHAVINDLFYGGALQNVIGSSSAINLPLWFNEGLAEYLSLGWDTNTDMFIRDAAISEYLPDIPYLGGYFAYRGGQSVFYYIAKKYGREKIGEFVSNVRGKGSVEAGIKASIGLTLEELNERWKKDIKRTFWPDITVRKDPDEFAKRLTDPKKDAATYNTSPAISPDGEKIAFISNRDVFFDLYVMNSTDGKEVKRLVKGNRTVDFEELNILTPGLTWSPDGKKLAMSAKTAGSDAIFIIDAESGNVDIPPVLFPGIGSVDWSKDGRYLTFSAHKQNQSDIYIYDFETGELKNVTNDIFSDFDPKWSNDGKRIIFSSDRGDFLRGSDISDTLFLFYQNFSQLDLYMYDIDGDNFHRLTNLPYSDERFTVVSPDDKEILFVSDFSGINNIYKKSIELVDASTPFIDNPMTPITNSLNGLEQISVSSDGKRLAMTSMYNASYNIFTLNSPFNIRLEQDTLPFTAYMEKLRNPSIYIENGLDSSDTTIIEINEPKTEIVNVEKPEYYSDSVKIDYGTYIIEGAKPVFDTSKYSPRDISVVNNFDEDSNYVIKKYKTTFSPDLVYANAGYSTYYGFLGTTVLSFSDVLGDHRLVGFTSLQIDLKNSDYGISYYYLKNRVNMGIDLFHTARFVYQDRAQSIQLYRYRNFGANLSFSYPLNRFYRLDFGLGLLNATQTNLDDAFVESRDNTFLVPSVSFVHDNTIFGYTAPIDGSRYRLEIMANPIINPSQYGFYSINYDYRNYLRFWYDYSFAIRLSGGFSWGNNPQKFFIGGVENWVNRQWSTGRIPLDSPSDFVFLSAGLPLRGYDYAERIGSKYTIANFELRFPFIRYLVTGALPILFSNIMGAVFFDAGAAWDNTSKLQFITRNEKNNLVTKDLLMGTGVGARVYFLYFLLRFDVAWKYDIDSFSKPIFYFSIGTDF